MNLSFIIDCYMLYYCKHYLSKCLRNWNISCNNQCRHSIFGKCIHVYLITTVYELDSNGKSERGITGTEQLKGRSLYLHHWKKGKFL